MSVHFRDARERDRPDFLVRVLEKTIDRAGGFGDVHLDQPSQDALSHLRVRVLQERKDVLDGLRALQAVDRLDGGEAHAGVLILQALADGWQGGPRIEDFEGADRGSSHGGVTVLQQFHKRGDVLASAQIPKRLQRVLAHLMVAVAEERHDGRDRIPRPEALQGADCGGADVRLRIAQQGRELRYGPLQIENRCGGAEGPLLIHRGRAPERGRQERLQILRPELRIPPTISFVVRDVKQDRGEARVASGREPFLDAGQCLLEFGRELIADREEAQEKPRARRHLVVGVPGRLLELGGCRLSQRLELLLRFLPLLDRLGAEFLHELARGVRLREWE